MLATSYVHTHIVCNELWMDSRTDMMTKSLMEGREVCDNIHEGYKKHILMQTIMHIHALQEHPHTHSHSNTHRNSHRREEGNMYIISSRAYTQEHMIKEGGYCTAPLYFSYLKYFVKSLSSATTVRVNGTYM